MMKFQVQLSVMLIYGTESFQLKHTSKNFITSKTREIAL